MPLANIVTVMRMVLIPVFVVLLFERQVAWALLAFVLAAVSDALDGFIARRTQTTTLGRFLDPMADKLMLVSAFIALPFVTNFPVWVTVLVVGRDVVISLGFLITYLLWHSAKVSVRLLGKITTLVQSVGIGVIMLAVLFTASPSLVPWLAYLIAAVTLASGLDYVLFGIQQARRLSAEKANRAAS
jgi:cardiolipin synthase (CMP-forming)